MATLTNTKIKDTYKSLLKVSDNGNLEGGLQEITDGEGNASGVQLNTGGDLTASGTVAFGSLKDSGENITIAKFVDEADGIAGNDNDTSIPTSAAVKDYVDTNVTAQDLDFVGDSGSGAVDLDSQNFSIQGTTNEVVTSASGQTLTIGLPSSISVDVVGDLTGNVSGNVTGNLTGNVSGNVTGDVTGNLTGNVNGNVTGNVTGDLTGNADTASQLATARDIVISGDVSGSALFDGSSDINISTIIQPNSVALGADTTGDYVANLGAGTGVSIGSNTGEGSNPTISVNYGSTSNTSVEGDTALTIQGTTNEIEVSGGAITLGTGGTVTVGLPDNVIIAGDLTVNGTTTTVNTETLSVEDPLIELANQNASNSVDTGFFADYSLDAGVTTKYAGLFKDAGDSDKFKLFKGLEVKPTTTVDTAGTGYTKGDLVVNDLDAVTISGTLTGDVTGDLTGTVLTAAQPNITSVGTLSSLAVSGDLTVDTSILKVDSANNRVGVGTATPASGYRLDVNGDIKSDGILCGSDSEISTIAVLQTSSIGISQLRMGDTDTDAGAISYENVNDQMIFRVNASEAYRVESSGRVNIAGATNNAVTFDRQLQTRGALVSGISGTTTAQLYLHRDDLTINSGDVIGELNYSAADGGSYVGAAITAIAANNWGGSNSPTHLSFQTADTSVSAPTESMRIHSNKVVSIGTGIAKGALRVLNDSDGGDQFLVLENTKYSGAVSSGETKLMFGWADHIAASITAFKQASNKTGFKIFTENGYNVPQNTVTFPFGGGIAFNGDTAVANSLDDYEEGTIDIEVADAPTGGNTASIGGGTRTYTKIGRQVTVTIELNNIDTTGMTSGNLLHIRGLPFTVGTSGYGSVNAHGISFVNSNYTYMVAQAAGTTDYIVIRQVGGGQADFSMTVAQVDATTSDIYITVTYEV